MAQSSKPADVSAVSAAEQTLTEAHATLERERQRIKETTAQVDSISAAVGAANPDNVGDFADLVRERDTLLGLLEALALRESEAVASLHSAERAAEQAKAAELRSKATELEARIAKADAACLAEAVDGETRLLRRVRELKDLVDQRRELEPQLGNAAGHIHSMTFGSEWAGFSTGNLTLPVLDGLRRSRDWNRANGWTTGP